MKNTLGAHIKASLLDKSNSKSDNADKQGETSFVVPPPVVLGGPTGVPPRRPPPPPPGVRPRAPGAAGPRPPPPGGPRAVAPVRATAPESKQTIQGARPVAGGA